MRVADLNLLTLESHEHHKKYSHHRYTRARRGLKRYYYGIGFGFRFFSPQLPHTCSKGSGAGIPVGTGGMNAPTGCAACAAAAASSSGSAGAASGGASAGGSGGAAGGAGGAGGGSGGGGGGGGGA